MAASAVSRRVLGVGLRGSVGVEDEFVNAGSGAGFVDLGEGVLDEGGVFRLSKAS